MCMSNWTSQIAFASCSPASQEFHLKPFSHQYAEYLLVLFLDQIEARPGRTPVICHEDSLQLPTCLICLGMQVLGAGVVSIASHLCCGTATRFRINGQGHRKQSRVPSSSCSLCNQHS